MNTLFLFVGIVLIILGLVMHGSRAGYFTFIVRPSTIISLAIIITVVILGVRAIRSETNTSNIYNEIASPQNDSAFAHASSR